MRNSAVDVPAVAVFLLHEGIGFGSVGAGAGLAVVADLFAGAVGHEAEKHHFDHIRAVAEVAGGLLARVFAGIEPLLLEVAFADIGELVLLFAWLVVAEIRVVTEGNDHAGVEVGNDEAFRALEHRAVADLREIDGGLR